jgi:putative membrane-bound dehydrogenase-like protein
MNRFTRIAILLVAAACAAGRAADPPAAASPQLPHLARDGRGVWRVDLDGDGHEDIVVSNEAGYGVYLFVPPDKARDALEWKTGWTRVMREGRPGDADALPPLTGGDVSFAGGVMRAGDVRMTFEDLLRVPGPPPKAPAESRATMRVRDGFTVTLAAAEPLVMDPVFIDWDERGRMWVAEMGDYPFAEGEATRDGSVTWRDGVPGEGADRPLRAGRVRILEDADGDGRYESATLFLDGLRHVTGLACWKGGVFIANIPDIFYAKDDDGDGRCDRREPWFTGFTAGNPQHLVNGFCWGLDGWLHGANGDSGGQIECLRTGSRVALGRSDFRFDPRTGDFRLETGCTQCGKWRDDFGNWFGNNNANPGWHYWLPMSHLERHPELVVASVRADLTPDRRVFPVGPPVRRLNQISATDTLTSGCNPLPYRDEAFGDEGRDVMFICEPANNLVLRRVLDYSGDTIVARRHPADAGREFLASDDRWFRPVMARTGPDGAVYVVDMYRLVLEHPEWVPAEMARRMQLRGGETMGRIWRIAPAGLPTRAAAVSLASANGWARDTAQRLAIEAGRLDDEAAVRSLADAAAGPVRVQALFTLHALGLLPREDLLAALGPLWPRVRGAALVAAGSGSLAAAEEALLAALAKAAATSPARPVEKPPAITGHEPDRQKVVGRYLAAAEKPGDASRGRAVFRRAGCAACHRLGGLGVEVGPDLAAVGGKPAAQLVEAIFDPHRAVEQRYAMTVAVLVDGTAVSGLVVAETPTSLTIRSAGGAERVLRRADVDELSSSPTSLMPTGLETLMSVDDCADLLAAMRAP